MKTWIFLCLLIFAASCTIQKRHFRKGYTIDWKKNNRSNASETTQKEDVGQAESNDIQVDFEDSRKGSDEIIEQELVVDESQKVRIITFFNTSNQVHDLVKKQLTFVKRYTKGAADELDDDDLRFRHKTASTKLFALSGVTLVGACLFALGSATTVPIALLIILFGVALLLFIGGVFKYLKFYRQSDPSYEKSDKELAEDEEFRKKQGEKSVAIEKQMEKSNNRGKEVGMSIAFTFIVFAILLFGLGLYALLIGGLEYIVLLYFLGIAALILIIFGLIFGVLMNSRNADHPDKEETEVE